MRIYVDQWREVSGEVFEPGKVYPASAEMVQTLTSSGVIVGVISDDQDTAEEIGGTEEGVQG